MLTSDVLHPGWVRGWGVVSGEPPWREFRGVYATRAEAEEAAAEAGDEFHAHWGAYNAERDEFVCGPIPEAVA
ncbi:MAG: hypothetical protein JO032_12050 [Alphaproteobacteria bacterium]|nr:hypothetical protein [Alphaproteobacteria bacterium]MBV9553513.1 hypothetical protein [Alphaproteobacteria bacterium]